MGAGARPTPLPDGQITCHREFLSSPRSKNKSLLFFRNFYFGAATGRTRARALANRDGISDLCRREGRHCHDSPIISIMAKGRIDLDSQSPLVLVVPKPRAKGSLLILKCPSTRFRS
jgi:hypothetical protein